MAAEAPTSDQLLAFLNHRAALAARLRDEQYTEIGRLIVEGDQAHGHGSLDDLIGVARENKATARELEYIASGRWPRDEAVS